MAAASPDAQQLDALNALKWRCIGPPRGGRVIGMALDQMVVPGFAAFHVASEIRNPADPDEDDPEPSVDLDTPAVELGPDAGEE